MLLRLAQVSMAVSLYFTGRALYHTWGHGFEGEFAGQPYIPHAQFHAVREVFMALGLVLIIVYLLYGPASVRTRLSWYIMLVASVFLTVGVLVSLPITGTSLPPGGGAAMNHIGNTVFAGIALALCWKFYPEQTPPE